MKNYFKRVLINRLILKIIFAVLLFSNIANSQVLNRHVVGSGGRAVENNGVRINCTIGQTHIGLLKPPSDTIVHGVGYWYAASYIMNNPEPVCDLIIPNLSAEIGFHVSVPLILLKTDYNYLIENRHFRATISYNSTVLQPIKLSPNCNSLNGNVCSVTIEGEMTDSVGVIAYIDFLVRLGSVEKSPLIIDDFQWIDSKKVHLKKQDGELELLGICREGDTIRLVKKSVEAGLYASYPEPASDQTLINFSLSEKGYTKISLINNLGRDVFTIFDGIAEIGRQSVLVDLTDISSGLYYINLITPTERFSRKLLIQK
ncbi:MAG: T9SS type A sorting domain-containing protein [bacterium]